MEEKIKELHSQGMTYSQICDLLGCTKSLVSYYINPNGKARVRANTRKRRAKIHPFKKKLETFLYVETYQQEPKTLSEKIKWRKRMTDKISDFQKESKNKTPQNINSAAIQLEDVLEIIGNNPTCYLTGDPIDIYDTRSYNFDHIQPRSRGGQNTIENLGVCTRDANQAKNDFTLDEFIELCKKVLIHNGYDVTKSS